MQHILMFKLGGGESFAIDALAVREIILPSALHSIPGSSEMISGCINFRGKTVPVIDLSKVLFGTELQGSMVIVLDKLPFGLRVASVTQISKMFVKFDEKALFSRRFVDGVFLGEDGSLIQMLNIDKIICHIDKRSLAA